MIWMRFNNFFFYDSVRLCFLGLEGLGQLNYVVFLMLFRFVMQMFLGECVFIIEELNLLEYIYDIEDILFFLNCVDEEIEYVEFIEFNVEVEFLDCGGGGFVYVELNELVIQNGSEEFSMEILIVQESEGCIEDVVEEVILLVVGEEVVYFFLQEFVLLVFVVVFFFVFLFKSVLCLWIIYYV